MQACGIRRRCFRGSHEQILQVQVDVGSIKYAALGLRHMGALRCLYASGSDVLEGRVFAGLLVMI